VTQDIATIREELLEIIEKEGLIAREKLVPDATLESLNMASYDMVMVLMGIEEKYGIYLSVDTELAEIKTLAALLDFLAGRIAEGRSDPKPADEAPKADSEAE
jgi:acyl carrier protein